MIRDFVDRVYGGVLPPPCEWGPRFGVTPPHLNISGHIKRIPVFLILLALSQTAYAASPARDIREGNGLYQKGKYEQALKEYEQAVQTQPESDIVNFDSGTGYYKTGDYKNAIRHLEKALLSDDHVLQQAAYYNLGNALYQWGRAQEAKDLNHAVSSMEQALSGYESALKLNDKDEDARYNYKIVQQELERLKQKQQQQNQQQKQNQQNQQQEKQSQQESGQENQQSGQNEQKPSQQQGEQSQQQKAAQPSQQEQQKTDQTQETPQPSSGTDKKQEQSSGKEAGQPESAQSSSENERSSGADSNQMTPQDAKMLLNEYQRNEEPQGLLNFMKFKRQEQPVTKDW